jgi:hypothetical protein
LTIGAPLKNPWIRAELEALIAEHAYRIDFYLSDDLGELYTEDGCLYGAGPDWIGREAVNEYGRSRAVAKDRRARHVCTNFRFSQVSSDTIRGICFIMLFRSGSASLAPAEPIALADAHDIYKKCADGSWRIQERRIVLSFESEAHRLK